MLRAQEESRRAKTLVEERKLPPPKPSKILERHKHLKKDKANEQSVNGAMSMTSGENEFKEPLLPPRKMQRPNSITAKGKEVLADASNKLMDDNIINPVLKKQVSDENQMNVAN